MMATLRLALYYFVLYRAQRWLLAIGAGILVLGLAMGKMDRATAVAMLLIQGLAVPLAALTFRELSMRQSASLAPHVRPRMLASLLVFAGLVALTAAVLAPNRTYYIVTGGGATEAASSFPTLLAVHFGLVSLVVLVVAVLPVSLTWWFAFTGAYLGFRGPLEAFGFRWLLRNGMDPVLPVITISALAWVGFAWWYLTAPAIGRTWGVWPRGWSARRPVKELATLTPEHAAALLLSGGVPTGWRESLVAGAVGAGALWLLSLVFPLVNRQAAMFLFTMSAVLALSAASAALLDAQRARMLWLTHGSRAEIFRLCERGALHRCAPLPVAMACMAAYAWVGGLVGLPEAIWLAAFGASLGCAATYLGLLFVAGRHRSELLLAGGLLVSWFATVILAAAAVEGAVGPALAALPLVALVAEGLVCRRLTRRRWERIDWLRQRPIRWLTPPSPRVRYGR